MYFQRLKISYLGSGRAFDAYGHFFHRVCRRLRDSRFMKFCWATTARITTASMLLAVYTSESILNSKEISWVRKHLMFSLDQQKQNQEDIFRISEADICCSHLELGAARVPFGMKMGSWNGSQTIPSFQTWKDPRKGNYILATPTSWNDYRDTFVVSIFTIK